MPLFKFEFWFPYVQILLLNHIIFAGVSIYNGFVNVLEKEIFKTGVNSWRFPGYFSFEILCYQRARINLGEEMFTDTKIRVFKLLKRNTCRGSRRGRSRRD